MKQVALQAWLAAMAVIFVGNAVTWEIIHAETIENPPKLPGNRPPKPELPTVVDPLDRYFIDDESIFTRREPSSRPTIVLQLKGELGNNLGFVASAHAIARQLYDDHNMTVRIALRHQEGKSDKWKRPMQDMIRCFPAARHWDFAEGNLLIHNSASDDSDDPHGLNRLSYRNRDIRKQALVKLVKMLQKTPVITFSMKNLRYHPFLDDNYDYYRRLFRFDREQCCRQRPSAKEIVFHFRNYETELPGVWKKWGFEEIDPETLERYLRQHPEITIDTPLTILSRFPQSEPVQRFGRVLSNPIRTLDNTTGVSDFCYLLEADRIIGAGKSTFFQWAALLGKARKAYVYWVWSNFTHDGEPVLHNFTHPVARRRMELTVQKQ